jgi:histidinol-phosphate aminotransferase
MTNLKNIVRPNIWGLKAYSSARDEFSGKEGVFLDANENPYGELNRYPDPHQTALKQQLAQIKGVELNNIFVGNGSDEVIDLAFRIFCNPGIDKALTFTPTYGMYDVSAAINDVKLLKIALNQEFQIDIKKVKPYLSDDRIKLIFICSPNNPTGNLINKSDIKFILDNFNGIVVLDEAYIDFANEVSWINLINQYNNLIVSQTFSKAWGLAAARVGLAYANKDLIDLFSKVKPPYNVSELNQKAAIKALENQDDFKANLDTILSERDAVKVQLQQLDIVKKIYPSEANFLLVEVADADYVYKTLVNQKIITRNRNQQVRNCIRITIGTPAENVKLINGLKNIK